MDHHVYVTLNNKSTGKKHKRETVLFALMTDNALH